MVGWIVGIVALVLGVVWVILGLVRVEILPELDVDSPVDLSTWTDDELTREWFACEYWIGEGDQGAAQRKAEVEIELIRRAGP